MLIYWNEYNEIPHLLYTSLIKFIRTNAINILFHYVVFMLVIYFRKFTYTYFAIRCLRIYICVGRSEGAEGAENEADGHLTAVVLLLLFAGTTFRGNIRCVFVCKNIYPNIHTLHMACVRAIAAKNNLYLKSVERYCQHDARLLPVFIQEYISSGRSCFFECDDGWPLPSYSPHSQRKGIFFFGAGWDEGWWFTKNEWRK